MTFQIVKKCVWLSLALMLFPGSSLSASSLGSNTQPAPLLATQGALPKNVLPLLAQQNIPDIQRPTGRQPLKPPHTGVSLTDETTEQQVPNRGGPVDDFPLNKKKPLAIPNLTPDDVFKEAPQPRKTTGVAGNNQTRPTGPDREELAYPTELKNIDQEAYNEYLRYVRAYYRYKADEIQVTRKAFLWQDFASKVVFWCVILLIVSGVVFSGVQFFKSFKTTAVQSEEVELNLQGLKIKSSFVGLAVLAISLAFFFLYLKFVYPIEIVK